jgi:hypothetical protein
MQNAKTIAEELAALFLRNGSFTFSSARRSPSGLALLPAATTEEVESFFSEGGFAGLSVQSVGWAEGDEDTGQRVHVYLTKGRSREQIFEATGKQIPIEVHRIGKMIVNPEQAAGATHQGQLFVHGGRIACGSSCAPTGETYSGTFGALVRKQGRRKEQLYILSANHVLAACNHIPVEMPILSPSSADGGPTLSAPREIGRHAEICELRSGEPSLVSPCSEDAALARVTEPNHVTSWQGPAKYQGGYDTPTNIVAVRDGMRVKKIGRTTGLTLGTVEAKLLPFPCRTS